MNESIVDVAGTRFMAIIEYFPGTAPDKLAEARFFAIAHRDQPSRTSSTRCA